MDEEEDARGRPGIGLVTVGGPSGDADESRRGTGISGRSMSMRGARARAVGAAAGT